MANYKITQGDSFVSQISYQDSSASPINLAGYTGLYWFKDKPGGNLLCATASIGPISASGTTTGDGITVTSASSGIFLINITSAKTQNFNYPRTAHQFQVTSPNGVKITLDSGWFEVDAGVID